MTQTATMPRWHLERWDSAAAPPLRPIWRAARVAAARRWSSCPVCQMAPWTVCRPLPRAALPATSGSACPSPVPSSSLCCGSWRRVGRAAVAGAAGSGGPPRRPPGTLADCHEGRAPSQPQWQPIALSRHSTHLLNLARSSQPSGLWLLPAHPPARPPDQLTCSTCGGCVMISSHAAACACWTCRRRQRGGGSRGGCAGAAPSAGTTPQPRMLGHLGNWPLVPPPSRPLQPVAPGTCGTRRGWRRPRRRRGGVASACASRTSGTKRRGAHSWRPDPQPHASSLQRAASGWWQQGCMRAHGRIPLPGLPPPATAAPRSVPPPCWCAAEGVPLPALCPTRAPALF